MGRTAIVVGSAAPVWGEVERALKLFTPDEVFCINEALVDYPGHVNHLVSFHPEIMVYWLNKRKKKGKSRPDFLWTYSRRKLPKNMPAAIPTRRVPNWQGSSGLLGVASAIELGCDRIVICGIHIVAEASHYHEPNGAPWKDANNYRKGWLTHIDLFKNVTRSMGGWTQDLLGAPTKEWLEATQDAQNTAQTSDKAGDAAPAHRGAAR